MNDDYAGDVSTNGRMQVNGSPVLISSDFFDDPDWFLVSGFRKFYDYRISVFLPADDLIPISGSVRVGIYDANGNALRDKTQLFRTQHEYTHAQNSGSRFLGIMPRSTGFYRSQVLEADITGDTWQTSRDFQPNFGQRHAGSITANDDVDMFRVYLRGGRTYTFDLLGNSSNGGQGTTLGDPHLQLYAFDTLVAEDDNSGSGTNARLTFTPQGSSSYYVRVSGKGTQGTYLLGLPDLDDYPGSTESEARLQLSINTVGLADWDGDEDWFRFYMHAGYTYSIDGNSGRVDVRLHDRNGALISQSASPYQAKESGDVFVAAIGTGGGFGGGYRIAPSIIDDYPATELEDARTLSRGVTIGAMEDGQDSDLLKLDLEPFTFYNARVNGLGNRPLRDAQLTTYDTNGNVLETFQAGENVRLRAFGQETDPTYISVSSKDENFGAWTLNHTIDDFAASDTSTGWNVQFIGGRGFVRNSIDFDGDADFHRVRLLANSWYELDRGTFNADYSVRRPDGSEVDFDQLVGNGDKSYFYATQTGDHFLVVRDPTSDVPKPRGYTMSIRQNAAYQTLNFSETSEWFNTSNIGFRFGSLPLEVYSEVPMQAGSLTIEPNTLTEVTEAQWAEISVADSFDKTGDVYLRGVYGNGLKQDWSRIEVAKVDLTPEIVTENLDRYVRFKFTETLPPEYANDPLFSNFEALEGDDRTRFNFAAFAWGHNIASISLPRTTSSSAEMNVFKADLGVDQPPVVSYAPGEGRGYDVIINSSFNALDGSPESVYQLLQGIGIGIGMQVSDSVDRLTSVMGTRVEPGLEDVYPSTPLAADRIMAFQGTVTNTFQSNGPVGFVKLNGDEPLAMGLFATDSSRSRRYIVSATGSADPVEIDLRQGSESTVLGDVYRVVENGPDAILLDGLGGFGDDGLVGNEGSNRLAGYGGNDVLRGGSGNDRLEGGRGNDYYIFRPASHQDVIREASPTADGGSLPSGGLDVVRIEGMYDYDSIQEDITFARLGNDLLIRLELNGRLNVNGDGIRITDMNDPEKRVEALSLLNPGGFVERISLASVFEQADSTRRRFEVLAGRDDFGSLVQPV